jgi:HSP20 family protein
MPTKDRRREQDKEKTSPARFDAGLGGILKGLGDLVEKLNDLAETGQEFSKTGELRGDSRDLKGIYGFTVKVGLGGDKPVVESFGNIRRNEAGRTVVQEVREPVADVFDEQDHVLVVVEMPGISVEDVAFEVAGDVLSITAAKGDKKYRKEVLLPASFSREQLRLSCNHGVLEIKCTK